MFFLEHKYHLKFQIIVQKIQDDNNGFSIVLEDNPGSTVCNLMFIVTTTELVSYIEHEIEKGKFSHISAIFDRDSATSTLKLIINGQRDLLYWIKIIIKIF